MGYRVQVVGRVQGVFFRASTKTEADNLGLTGWVKNESDGSVLIEVEGAEESLELFLKWCKNGPSIARVDDIKITEIPIQGFKEFEITY
ncbi:acylphosphatase [Ekhidna sp.]